jgi:hypothetical protein
LLLAGRDHERSALADRLTAVTTGAAGGFAA